MPALTTSNGWHPGELQIHQALNVPTPEYNPTIAGLPSRYGQRITVSPLVALGALDSQSRPWTTIVGGERGFARPVADNVLGMKGRFGLGDPVLRVLMGGESGRNDEGEIGMRAVEAGDIQEGKMVRPQDSEEGKVFSGLSIDLETRDRVKFMGRFVGGVVGEMQPTSSADDGGDVAAAASRYGKTGEAQLAFAVQESLGNCPKYLNKRKVEPCIPQAASSAVEEGLPLSSEAVGVIEQADMLFLSSGDEATGMDTNHRGGGRGFVRVGRNYDGATEIVYPEFSGNRLYQTLGNLRVNPRVGITIPNYDTGDVLYTTGTASILIGPDAASLLPRTSLAIKITLTSAVYIPKGLPFRVVSSPSLAATSPPKPEVEYSPYNPPVRPLVSEGAIDLPPSAQITATATLTKREHITPTVSRFSFNLSSADKGGPLPTWRPGQHITLDFSSELDHGYSHMRDDDPQSLNDDFVRTFTVSSVPPTVVSPARPGNQTPEDAGKDPQQVQLQITARKHGPATSLLWRHNILPRGGLDLDVPVRGFGGEETFNMANVALAPASTRRIFVAAGVGITPLLAQAPGLLASGAVDLAVLWSLRVEDLGLAVDSFRLVEGLAGRTRLFVTGGWEAEETAKEDEDMLSRARELGVKEIVMGRMTKSAVLEEDGEGGSTGTAEEGKKRKYFLCTAPGMLARLREWLEDEDIVWEDFGY